MESKHDETNGEDSHENLEELPETGAPEANTREASELEAARTSESDAKKALLYLKAEFDNYKKRILREQEQEIKFANEKLIGELLPVVDLLERALGAGTSLQARKEDKEAANFVTGVSLTHRELINVLGRLGVEFIGNVGEKFDPVRHEAITQRPSAEHDEGTVLEVLQKGCLLKGRLLQPAKVVVAAQK